MCNHSFQSASAHLRGCWLFLIVCVSATALTASAQSFTIGPNTNTAPGAITYASTITQDPTSPSETAWILGTAGLPFTISYNPGAGVWEKDLSGAGPLDLYQEVNLLEYVKVGAGQQWTDWHETVLTTNFIWGYDADDTFYTIDGGAAQTAGIVYNADHTVVTFNFSPDIAANSVIMIHKELQYMGADTFDNDTTAVVINEFPSIPEPSTLALMGVGLAGLVLRRRRATN
jgi:hypothetical protein